MGVEWLFARRGLDTHRGAVGQEIPALLIVLEIRRHDLVDHLLVHGRIENRAQNFDAAVEVARHQVGGRNIDRGLAVRQGGTSAGTEDGAVVERPADERLYAGAAGQSGAYGTPAANA